MIYSAYTKIKGRFETFEQAMGYLDQQPGAQGCTPEKVSVVTQYTDDGVVVESLDGEEVAPEFSQAYVVAIGHQAGENLFTIEYVIEYGSEEEDGENDGHEEGVESGFGDEADSEQPDKGTGEGGEESVETPVVEQPIHNSVD